MKKIAVNALTIDSRPSGGKTYLLNLVNNLGTISGDDYHYLILAVSGYKEIYQDCLSNKNTTLIEFPRFVGNPILRILVEQFYLPIWLKSRKIDLLFAARNIMPVMTDCPTVIGVLSMHLNYEKEEIPIWRRIYGSQILKYSAKKAEAYVAISRYAGETYIEKYKLPKERLFVAPLGFNSTDIRKSDLENPHPEKRAYLLFVSTLFPHKNVAFLIKVFNKVLAFEPELDLVIVGRDFDSAIASLESIADSLQIKNRVHFTGGVTDNELRRWYANALLFVFPSLTEGFGLSVLEAMAFGVPVVASNRTSIPEVVGNAGIVLDPIDEEEWAKAIVSIIDNDEEYSRFSKLAKERAKLYSWKRTAEITLDCFKQVLEMK